MHPGQDAVAASLPRTTDLPARLTVRDISKAFPGVLANDRVSLDVRPGEVHALLGENGAGKTTLMHILYGIYQPDAGEIVVDGAPAHIRSPRDAIALGIGMVPQHFLLIRRHTVAENVALGLAETRFFRPLAPIEARIREFGARYGLRVDPRARIWQLSVSEQQRVEILKALLRGAQILILDEPTSVLTPQEAEQLFAVLRRMKTEGQAVIFITHKLDEVFAVADRVTVLRRGQVVGTVRTADADRRTLAQMMVGRHVEQVLPAHTLVGDAEALAVDDLWVRNDRGLPAVRGLSFAVRSGEIVGVAGVAGNGQSELVGALTGLRGADRGTVRVRGRDITNHSARAVHESGVAHIPEERIAMGVVPAMTVAENLVLNRYRYPPFVRGAILDGGAIGRFAARMIAEYGITTPGSATPARSLSGGNLQKLILARELSTAPGLIVAMHPTYGLDVGATQQIHTLLVRRRDDGAGVLLVSEDLEEILTLCDRVIVLFDGRDMGTVTPGAVNRETIGLMMAGQRL
ncbi:MAG TPA: ABC transporter ATP-binding protein [bacterium]|jgi:simple sugar transport system ATP-binding protein